jgi:hypothetical protein
MKGVHPALAQSLLDSLHSEKIRLIMKLRRSGITDTRVLGAVEQVPREQFVDNFVPFVFKLFDAGSHQFEMGVPFGDPICQSLSGLGNNAGLVVKLFEEFLFLGKKSHSASVNATWQSFKRVVRPRSINP